MGRAVAFVTGASRGIGRASAIALARAGFDVALTARTVHEGEGRVETPYSGGLAAAPVAVAGSLETTAAEIDAEGVDALPVQMDLLATESLDAAVAAVLDRFGRVDLLLNNAIWSGPGLLDRIESLDLVALERALFANALQQVALIQRVLPAMIEQGGGRSST